LAREKFDAKGLIKIMNVKDKIVFVTGGANGIGRALCERFAAEDAKKVVVADLDYENAQALANAINGAAVRLDVSDEAQVKTAVEQVLGEFGQIDLVCSNAGIGGAEGCLEVSNDVWQKIYEINVLSHLYLSRAVFPSMIECGEGYFLITASAAGLLTHPTAAPYARQQTRGGRVCRMAFDCLRRAWNKISCLCPQGVIRRMIGLSRRCASVHAGDNFVDGRSL
jgi:NAD(P)-dependent dehydrogenase (short-subunit alcohol dehydrogenase family)